MIGLRIREVPILQGSAILKGVVGLYSEEPLEAAIPVPYPLCGDIGIGEAWLSEQPWAVSELEQSYNFSAGELSSSFLFRVGENAVVARITTFASRSDPALVLQQVELTSEAACEVRLRPMVGTTHVRGHAARRMIGAEAQAGDGVLLWIPEGGMSCCGIAFSSECATAEDEPQFRQKHGSGPLIKEYRVKLKPGRPSRLQQITAMVPALLHHRPDEEAVRRLGKD